jgi:capsular polysaccharide transport system permease protein
LRNIIEFLRPRNLRLLLVAAPMILGGIYLFGIAADRFVSESVVSVRQSGSSGAGLEGLAMLLVPQAGSGRQDSMVLQEYLLSMDVLKLADERLGLRKAYSDPSADFVFRLSSNATRERFLAYFQSRVEVLFDDTSGLLKIRTQAFSPEVALKLNQFLVEAGEQFINEVSHRLAREQLVFSETELAKARNDLQNARLALEAFQREYGSLDPTAQAVGSVGLSVHMQGELSRKEAELKGLLGFMDPNSLQIKTLRDEVAGMRAQLDTEAKRALRAGSGRELNQLAIDFKTLEMSLEFAQQAYKLALTASEASRIESVRKMRHVVLVESPVLPQAAEYPRRWYNLLALALGFALLYGIVRLVLATIEDHLEQ